MRYLTAVALLLLLGACTQSSTALLQTFKTALTPRTGVIDTAKLDPRYRYLRVTHPGGISGMVLGYIDETPTGPVEVWYASDGELLRLENGRLAGNSGLAAQWRGVRLPALPSWPELAREPQPFRWQRERDVMPGYHYGVRDKLALTVIAPPSKTGLVGIDPAKLTWFEERTEASSDDALPPARYAVDGNRVVYGEQCVSRESCFRWQRWPAGA